MFKHTYLSILFFFTLLFVLSGCQKTTILKINSDTSEKSTTQNSTFVEREQEEKTVLDDAENLEQSTENDIIAYTKDENKVKLGDTFIVEEIEYCISSAETSKDVFGKVFESDSYFREQLDSKDQLPQGKTMVWLMYSVKNLSSNSQDVNFNKSFCKISEDNRVVECPSEGCTISQAQPGKLEEDFFQYSLSPNETAEVQIGYLLSDKDIDPELYCCVGYLGSQTNLDINRFIRLELP